MKQDSQEELAAELVEIDNLLKAPDPRPGVADRIHEIMRTAQGAGANASTSSFILGQVFEILKPMRERHTLTARRAAVQKSLDRLIASQDE